MISAAGAAANIDWSAFRVGDRVELDVACSGTWRIVSIQSIGADVYSAKARSFTIRRADGSDWTFSAPGIVAPCMRPLSASAAMPVRASGPAQPLQGLYLQLQSSGTGNQYIYYYFWKDGRLCAGLPIGGLDREPVPFEQLQQKQTCGQYRVSGNRMTLRLQGEASAHDVSLGRVRADGFDMNGFSTSKLSGWTEQKRFEATYTASVVGDRMSRDVYVFHANGNYEFSSTPVTSRDGALRRYGGSYRFLGNTLELTGGPEPQRLTAAPFPNGGLMIGGTVFAD
jgi:hypothetical protein